MLNDTIKSIINRNYDLLIKGNEGDTSLIAYNAWKPLWTSINGEVINSSSAIEKFEKQYKLEIKDASKFLFAIETFFATHLHIYSQSIYLKKFSKNTFSKPIDIDFVKSILCTNYCAEKFENTLELGVFSWFIDYSDSEYLNFYLNHITSCDQNGELEVNMSRGDFLGKIYESLFPKSIRHFVGAYFTPEWMCELILQNTLFTNPNILNSRILEPTCGSGVFVVTLWKKISENLSIKPELSDSTYDFFSRNVVAFEKNPISVLSAKANFQRILVDLYRRPINNQDKTLIQVYFSDCIDEADYHDINDDNLFKGELEISIAERVFTVTSQIIKSDFYRFKKNL